MAERYIFDLPVYRLTQEQREAEGIRYAMQKVFPAGTLHGNLFRQQAEDNPAEYQRKLTQTIHSLHRGDWMFNEIVGYIRLHFVGTQVRGEYYAPSRKRISRSKTRDFQFQTWKLAPEVEIDQPITTASIANAIDLYIAACRKEIKHRHIDASIFHSLSPHVDWLQLYGSESDA